MLGRNKITDSTLNSEVKLYLPADCILTNTQNYFTVKDNTIILPANGLYLVFIRIASLCNDKINSQTLIVRSDDEAVRNLIVQKGYTTDGHMAMHAAATVAVRRDTPFNIYIQHTSVIKDASIYFKVIRLQAYK